MQDVLGLSDAEIAAAGRGVPLVHLSAPPDTFSSLTPPIASRTVYTRPFLCST